MALAVYPVINSQFEVIWGTHSSTSEEEPLHLEYTFTDHAVVRDFSATNQLRKVSKRFHFPQTSDYQLWLKALNNAKSSLQGMFEQRRLSLAQLTEQSQEEPEPDKGYLVNFVLGLSKALQGCCGNSTEANLE